MSLGSGEYKYRRVDGWVRIPQYFELGDIVGVAVDSQDRVFAFCRGDHPVVIFDREGSFVSCWGEGHVRQAHGLFIDACDSVYLVDGQAHTVEKYSPGGELLMTLGTRDRASSIVDRRPFNLPTGVAVGPTGEIFVSDGYGNFLVHKFSPEGELVKTWGEPGTGPGQFACPHDVAIDKQGTVYVCDRENFRIQVFTPDGEFVTQWTGLNMPADVYIDQEKDIAYVAEIGGPLTDPYKHQPRVSIRDLDGGVLSMWEGRESDGGGVLDVPHSVWIDSHGDIYEGEIAGVTGGVQRIQKFARVS